VAPSEREDAKSAQEIEVAPALIVVEVAALTALVEAIETEGLDDLGELGIEIARVKFEVLSTALLEQRG
jgi:hypothetical protein